MALWNRSMPRYGTKFGLRVVFLLLNKRRNTSVLIVVKIKDNKYEFDQLLRTCSGVATV